MKRFILGLFVVVLVSCFVVSSVSAVNVVRILNIDGGGGSGEAPIMQQVYPAGFISAYGNTFLCNTTGRLMNVSLRFSLYGTPDSLSVGASVFNASGDAGSELPTTLVEDSVTTYSSLPAQDNPDWFNFSFSGDNYLVSGSKYAVVLYITAKTGSGGVQIYGRSGSIYSDGNAVDGMLGGATWNNENAEIDLKVYVDLDAEVTPTPSASAVASVEPQPVFFENFVRWLVPMGLILGLGLLLWKFAGKWGFFSGMIIGLVVSYVFLDGASNLWAYVIVGVVLMTAMFASTRGNS